MLVEGSKKYVLKKFSKQQTASLTSLFKCYLHEIHTFPSRATDFRLGNLLEFKLICNLKLFITALGLFYLLDDWKVNIAIMNFPTSAVSRMIITLQKPEYTCFKIPVSEIHKPRQRDIPQLLF